ncbi:hypothetical protein RM553_13210 [Zunongwangia sp. F363]|uniref:Uncharacterized protein n=1 Tax=Autumnicola tepida TaxID=3075595 RepID=A0ABU3CCN2_9FLAO|nr:hypothetical protein [Zunongwangia sp. F363]MDT0643795.1 hypothetical protein [Zunongwangia sp. F363]
MNIKTATIAIASAILLISCYSSKAPDVNIGMSVDDFRKSAKYEELVSQDSQWIVYMVKYGWGADRFGYYYFKNDKLVRMDSEQDPASYSFKIARD